MSSTTPRLDAILKKTATDYDAQGHVIVPAMVPGTTPGRPAEIDSHGMPVEPSAPKATNSEAVAEMTKTPASAKPAAKAPGAARTRAPRAPAPKGVSPTTSLATILGTLGVVGAANDLSKGQDSSLRGGYTSVLDALRPADAPAPTGAATDASTQAATVNSKLKADAAAKATAAKAEADRLAAARGEGQAAGFVQGQGEQGAREAGAGEQARMQQQAKELQTTIAGLKQSLQKRVAGTETTNTVNEKGEKAGDLVPVKYNFSDTAQAQAALSALDQLGPNPTPEQVAAVFDAKPGLLDYLKTIGAQPGLAGETWWNNIKGGDIPTIAGTAAGVITPLALYQMLKKKQRKAAAETQPKPVLEKPVGLWGQAGAGRPSVDDSPAAQQQQYAQLLQAGNQPIKDTKSGDIFIGGMRFKADALNLQPTAAPEQNAISSNDLVIDDKPLNAEPIKPAAAAPTQAAPNLATQAGDWMYSKLPDSARDTLGMKSETMGYATAGVGAAALLGGVLLVNQLRKKKQPKALA